MPPTHAAEAPPGSAPYGLLALTANGLPGNTVAERAANYRRLYDAGVRAVRLDFPWTSIQPAGSPPTKFDFSHTDREVQAIRQAGLKFIGILDYGNPDYSSRGKYVALTPLDQGLPPFATGSASSYPPDNPADFARYARATAQHYAGDAVAWEVWNEENEGWRFWPPHEDPAAYARLLCGTYPEVKAVDPQTPVLFGGVFFPGVADAPGTSGPDFVAQAYQADPQLTRCYDAMAYHPYPYPFTSPEVDVPVRGSVLSAADQMRTVLQQHGDGGKPLWITEVGWPTSSDAYGVPEVKQAQYAARMALATFAQGVPVLTYYTYGDYSDPSGANQEAWFGFFHIDNSPKPSYTALRVFASVFAGTHFVADRSRELGLPPGQQNTGGRGFALRYDGPGETVTALWLANESANEGQGQGSQGGTAGPASVPVAVPVSAPAATVVDYMGARRTVTAQDGKIALQAGPGPQYVIDSAPGAGGGQLTLPASRPCASRRVLRVRVRVPSRSRLVRVAVYLNGRRAGRSNVRVRRGRLSAVVDLRGLPRGRVRVRVVARLRQGARIRTLTSRHLYHPCVPGRRSQAV
ncbi:MAG TPA: hypothetical protein VGY97_14095 [Solirubrobacteraceae bacterium]|nr:hypothetical protein [Solirubrobacteraceae bacterium]